MVDLSAPGVNAVVDPHLGGRIVSLVVSGTEVIVGPGNESGAARSPFDWGVYPMAPFAGRIRGGRFAFAGAVHDLEKRMPPHAIHGTVDVAPWAVVSAGTDAVVMECDLGPAWPYAGRVRHEISLTADSLEFVLALTADETMPAQVGWHPWLRRPAAISAQFDRWMPRDDDGMPTMATSVGLPGLDGPVDDCFVSAGTPVGVDVDGVRLSLDSDCSHWVVYTGAPHGVCVEPQSGPPNEVESVPLVLEKGETLRRQFRIAW